MNNPAVNTALPAQGTGFVTYNREPGGADQYGTVVCISKIVSFGDEWERRHPGRPFAVGDISRKFGGSFPPHAGHLNGTEFDLRPLRKDGRNEPCTWEDGSYDRELTRDFCRRITAFSRVSVIYFNDPVLIAERLTKRCAGHDNHLHVRFRLS
ncbi:MAG TPA: hypothetical protein VF521_03570 [Pyrinomonadaceae bacterium]|jgi:hypothetical protein